MKYIVLLLLLGACSFQAKPQLENSYIPRLQELTLHGLDALQHGRLMTAENALQRALNSAWLSADLLWIGRAQYHLGALHLAQGEYGLALVMLNDAQKNAVLTQDQQTEWRCVFALALLQQQTGEPVMATPKLQNDMPEDVFLSAGKLSHLQGDMVAAKKAYRRVASLDKDPDTIYLVAQAHLALALVARDEGEHGQALLMSKQVLLLAKEAGLPMLAGHALLLQGYLLDDVVKLEHAWQMYQVLGDFKGQYDALQALVKHVSTHQDEPRQKRWRKALKALENTDG